MLKKISYIRNFGIFKDFSWGPTMDDFKQDNLIYGWNYSGKTTLSRLFRILEKKDNQVRPDGLSFKLVLGDGKAITEQNIESSDLVVRVFNKDYVEKNFGTFEKDTKVGPIYIALGEDKSKKEELDRKNEELASREKELGDKEKEIGDKEKEKDRQQKALDKYKRNKAKDIKEKLDLKENKFRSDHLESWLEQETSKLESEDVLKRKLREHNQQKQDKVKFEKPEGVDIPESVVQKIKDLLLQEVSLNEQIPELERNPEKRKWAEEGLTLHKDATVCSFCDNTILEERIRKLESFFSGQYKRVQEEVKHCEAYLGRVIEAVNKIEFPKKVEFIESKRQDFENLDCKQMKQNYLDKLNTLMELIREKKNDITKKVTTDDLDIEYVFDLAELENLVQANNTDIDNISSEKERLKEKLISHFVEDLREEFNEENKKKTDITKELSVLQSQQKEIKEKIDRIKSDIHQLKTSTSSLDAGLDKLNQTIQTFLGHDELILEKVGNVGDEYISAKENAGTGKAGIEGKFLFSLKRGSELAKDLSEGEKTIISFAYFFTKLDSSAGTGGGDVTGSTMRDTIVFIDDPISSFDGEHLSYMASFIGNNLVEKCRQLFISTHNFTFFDFLRTHKTLRDKQGRIKRKFFIEAIKENSSSNGRMSRLVDLPELIDDFKSEYNYMFGLIYKFSQSSNPNDCLQFPSIPNAFRNFLETYCGIQYPEGERWTKQIKKFVKHDDGNPNMDLINQIGALTNRGSHLGGTNSVKPSMDDPETLQKAIKEVLKCIKRNTGDHFESLENSCSQDGSEAVQAARNK